MRNINENGNTKILPIATYNAPRTTGQNTTSILTRRPNLNKNLLQKFTSDFTLMTRPRKY